MMMPANYSAIAENEMTYVVGGGLIADILPAVMTVDNWKKVNTNMITLISNYTAHSFTNGTIGVLFDGDYKFGDVLTGAYDDLSGGTVLNGVLAVIGGLANIYTLGNVTASSVYNSSYGSYAWNKVVA